MESGQKCTKSRLTKKQREAAEMLANPDISCTKTRLCETVGVSRSVFYKWLKDSEFILYVNSLIDTYTDAELGAVWRALIHRCMAGDVQAIKLYFELKGKYKQQVEMSGELKHINPFEGLTTNELKKLVGDG